VSQATGLACLTKALDLAKSFVENQRDVVVAVLGTDEQDVYVGADYWTQPGRFELVVGTQALMQGSQQGTFITPLITRKDDFTQARHITDGPAGPEEDHLLWIFNFDLATGFEVGRLIYTPTVPVQWNEPEVLTGELELTECSPGFALLKLLLHSFD
jgi:hypothetical protein